MNRRLKRWGIALLICTAAIIPTSLALKHWMSSDSTGSVHVGAPTTTAEASQPQEPATIKTAYFTTLLPAGFTVRRQTETPNAAQTLLQMVADTRGSQDQQFAATVGIMPPDGLRGIGDYNLRMTNVADYAPFSPASLPTSAAAFHTTSGPTSFVVFWPHGTHYVEIAFSTSGGATQEQLLSTYAQAISAWDWL